MKYYHEPFNTALTAQEVEKTTGYLSPDYLAVSDLNEIFLYPINEVKNPFDPNLFTAQASYTVNGQYADEIWVESANVTLPEAKLYGKKAARQSFSYTMEQETAGSGYSNLALLAAASKLDADRGSDVDSFLTTLQNSMSDLNSHITDIDTAASLLEVQRLVEVLSTADVKVYKVTVSNGVFAIGGVEQESLTLDTGSTYRFNQNDSTNATHPLKIYEDAAKTTEVTTGITCVGTPGSVGAYTQFIPTTAGTFYYQCSQHADMGGEITVVGDDYELPSEDTDASYGTTASFGGSSSSGGGIFTGGSGGVY